MAKEKAKGVRPARAKARGRENANLYLLMRNVSIITPHSPHHQLSQRTATSKRSLAIYVKQVFPMISSPNFRKRLNNGWQKNRKKNQLNEKTSPGAFSRCKQNW